MSRGRKAETISYGSFWEEIFNKSQGFYFQYIVSRLGRNKGRLSDENAIDLLKTLSQEKEPLFKERKISKVKSEEVKQNSGLLFELPENWVWCKLEEIGEAVIGLTYKPSEISENGTPVLRANNIQDNKIQYDDVVKVTAKVRDKQIANIGDIVICVRSGSANLIGKSAIIDREGFSFGAFMSLFRSRFNDYIQLFMTSNLCKNQINDKKSTGINQLTQATLRNLLLPLPPLSEQKMILNFFNDFRKNQLDEKREYFDSEIENEVISLHQAQIYNHQVKTEISHQLDLIRQLRQAFLREAMQGKLVPQDEADEPAEILLERIKAEKEKLIAEKKIKRDKPLPEIKAEEIPFEIPNNWVWCRLGELIELVSGQHIETTDYNEKGEGFPYLTGPSDFGEVFPNPTKWTTKPKVFAEKDDILITVKGSGVGKTNISNLDKVVISRQLMAIRTRFISRFFIHYFLDNSFDLLQSEKKGTGIPGISRENILEKLFPLPPLPEQKRIVEKLEKLMKFCDELEAGIRESKAQAESLLQVALREALEPI
ncbi:MAG: restriction endonuclease subunit S [Acidobacteria bacterium]|nr:restriction endonuclease subunit S [Acidobacteriota bacterium]